MLVFEQYGILLSLYLNWLTAAQCCPLLNGIERETDELPRVQYGLQAADSTIVGLDLMSVGIRLKQVSLTQCPRASK